MATKTPAKTYYASKSDAISALTKIAKAEDGYLEKSSNKASALDSKTANAGYNNYTKYWRDLAIWKAVSAAAGFCGGPAWSWCAGFVSWIFCMAFGVELATKLLLHMPYTRCATLGDKADDKDMLYSDPKPGDVVLFHNGSRFSHTGFVYAVTDKTFYTIEGNTSSSKSVVSNGGGVHMKSYAIATYKKKGTKFFRPDYSIAVKAGASTPKKEETKAPAPAPAKKPAASSSKKVYATINTQKDPLRCRKTASDNGAIVGKFKKGAKVKVLQKTNADWWKVTGTNSENGKTITGYSSTEYLKEVK